MTDDPRQFVTVADYDQHHAEAIDWLREARTFLLAVPRPNEETGEWHISVTGGGVDFDKFLPAVSASLIVAGWDKILQAHRRDRWIRRLLYAVVVVNLFVVALNVSRLWW